MKRFVASVMTMLMITFAGMAGTAKAETGPTTKVNIPFEFSVGDRTYAAGEYSLTEYRPNLIAMYDARGRHVGIALTYARLNFKPSADSKVRFELVDGHYALEEVWIAGESTGAVFAARAGKRQTPEASSAKVRHDASRDKASEAN